MENNEVVLLVANLFLGGLIPFIAEPINNWKSLKKEQALVLVALLAGGVAVVSLLVVGQLTPADFTLAKFSQTFLVVWGVSQIVFNYAKVRIWPDSAEKK